jgi:predicted aldo/keto reductase-like oxidoreductase
LAFNEKTVLGKTALNVGRLGISSSYGAPSAAFEEAFERGCNYFTWGTFIKGRSSEMNKAIRNIIAKGQRDQLVIALWSYSHIGFLTEPFLRSALKSLGTDYVDVLLLGYYPKPPRARVLDSAFRVQEKGLARFIGVSGHNRNLFPILYQKNEFDVFHFRYNAAHRGAELDIFPALNGGTPPGMVSFTATRWGQLLNPAKMPPGEQPLSATDCYRFALNNPAVDVCMMGVRDPEQMRQNLALLEMPHLSEEEMARIRRIGDYLHSRKDN